MRKYLSKDDVHLTNDGTFAFATNMVFSYRNVIIKHWKYADLSKLIYSIISKICDKLNSEISLPKVRRKLSQMF